MTLNLTGLLISAATQAFFSASNPQPSASQLMDSQVQQAHSAQDSIVLGAGCFWCVEAVFASLEGVESATSGYMGGHIKNPAYREVCTGRTGHAEVVKVVFNPQVIGLAAILEVFFASHDPTTLNRQGADAGTQYRSVIFFTSDEQKDVCEEGIRKAQENWPDQIVTEITPASIFYHAEDYHQQYFELNGEAPYCRAVIAPKIKKVREQFAPLLKP